MTSDEALAILKNRKEDWNRIREKEQYASVQLVYKRIKKLDLSELMFTNVSFDHTTIVECDLSGSYLTGKALQHVCFTESNLTNVSLHYDRLDYVNFDNSVLKNAYIKCALLAACKMHRCNLHRACFGGTELINTTMTKCDMTECNLTEAILSSVDLSGSTGLLNASQWMADNFEASKLGYIVYRALNHRYYEPPASWQFEDTRRKKLVDRAVLTEVVNTNRCDVCGCGVSFGTLDWIKQEWPVEDLEIGRFLLEWQDLPGVIVPYNTKGKARCERLTYIGPVKE